METKHFIVRYMNKENKDKWCIVRAPSVLSEEEIMDLVAKEPDVSHVFSATISPDFDGHFDYTFNKN
jgi:hypothetical protein